LLNHPWLGPPIKDWELHRAIHIRHKAIATLMMGATALLVFPRPEIPVAGKVSYAIVVVAVLVFLWTRKSRG
jgi:uncharacterized membrane protein YbaN (DUF454 family)